MIEAWRQLAAWTPRLLLAAGGLAVLLVVIVIVKRIVEIFRQ